MSPRYTGEATMDEPALREVERWKEKIEVRLDNRQVFFLFFGSAMVACLLFVLGVIVGKRIESRGRAEAPVVDDPLALLDGLSHGGDSKPVRPQSALTFPRALLGRAGAGQPTLANTAPGSVAAATTVARTAAPAPQQAAAPSPKTSTAQGQGPAGAPAPTKVAAATPGAAPDGAKIAAPPRMRLAADTTARPGAAQANEARAAGPVTHAAPTPAAASSDTKPKGRFLLHLTSFNDRKQAEAFARRFAGANAYVAASEVPGKGTVYRVRVGNYASFDEAAAAKTNFEREHNVIAYVAAGAKP